MKQAIIDACESLRLALEQDDVKAYRSSAYAIRKGKTLYIVSSEAREMHRLDCIVAQGR